MPINLGKPVHERLWDTESRGKVKLSADREYRQRYMTFGIAIQKSSAPTDVEPQVRSDVFDIWIAGIKTPAALIMEVQGGYSGRS
jgi:hypothetical protein